MTAMTNEQLVAQIKAGEDVTRNMEQLLSLIHISSMCMNAGHAFSFKHMKRGFWVKIWSSSLTVASICMSFPF